MEDMREKLEKTLVKNYQKVQKKELEVSESTDKLIKDFSNEVSVLSKTLKHEHSAHNTSDKEIKEKYVKELATIKENNKLQLDYINGEISILESKVEEDLARIIDAHSSEGTKIKKEIDKLNKDYQKMVDTSRKLHDKNLSANAIDLDKSKEKASLEIAELEVKFQDAKKQYDETIALLNTEKDNKIDLISENLDKKVESLSSDITKEELRIEKKLEDSVPLYQKGLEEIEKGINFEQDQHDKKLVAMRSTLESKIARHEKFMNKNIKDNDQRAAKQHRKEIIALQKTGEKELRMLDIEFEEKTKDFVIKRKSYIRENFEKINSLGKKIIEFREEKLYAISNEKAEAYSKIEGIKLEYSKLLLDELHKFDEVVRDHDNKLAEVTRKNSLLTEGINHDKNLINLEYEKNQKLDEQKNIIELTYKEKELKRNDINLASKKEDQKLALKLSIAELEFDAKIAKKKLIQDIEISLRNEFMEYYRIDFNRQESIHKNQLAYQLKLKELFDSRAKSLFEYDDLEINNRFDLKAKFVHSQIEKLEKDKEKTVQRIVDTYQNEQVLYANQKTEISRELLEELKNFEIKLQNEIDKLISERDALEPKQFKKEAKEYDRNITEKREELRLGLEIRNNAILVKTALFDKGLEEVNSRMEVSLANFELFFQNEIGRLQSEYEYLHASRDQEMSNSKDRYSNTTEGAQAYYNQASTVCDNAIKESNSFLEARNQSEKKFIENARNLFSKQQSELKTQLNEYIAQIQLEKQMCLDKMNPEIEISEANFEAKIQDAKTAIETIESEYNEAVLKQSEILSKNNNMIEKEFSNELARISTLFIGKENTKRAKLLDIERSIANMAKNLDTVKKNLKRDYDVALAKELSALDQRLVQELRTI